MISRWKWVWRECRQANASKRLSAAASAVQAHFAAALQHIDWANDKNHTVFYICEAPKKIYIYIYFTVLKNHRERFPGWNFLFEDEWNRINGSEYIRSGNLIKYFVIFLGLGRILLWWSGVTAPSAGSIVERSFPIPIFKDSLGKLDLFLKRKRAHSTVHSNTEGS